MVFGFRSLIGLDKSSSTSSSSTAATTSSTRPSQDYPKHEESTNQQQNNRSSSLLHPFSRSNSNSSVESQQEPTKRRKSFSAMFHNLITDGENTDSEHDNDENNKYNNQQLLPPNHIGIEFTIGTVTLANDLSFTQYFSASILETCLTFSVKRNDEQEELLLLGDGGDDYKPILVQSSRIRKSPLSDGFTFKWKGEQVLLPIPLSDTEFQQVMNICNTCSNHSNSSNSSGSSSSNGSSSGNGGGGGSFNAVFEHSSSTMMELKKILPPIAVQLDNISTTSELLHNYIMKCKPHVYFVGEAVYDINRLMDFRSRSVEMMELTLKRGKDKTGVITLGMKLVLPQKPSSHDLMNGESNQQQLHLQRQHQHHHNHHSTTVESLHDFETISFDDSFILSGLRRNSSSSNVDQSASATGGGAGENSGDVVYCDSNFDVPLRDNSENLYEETHYELLEEVGRGSFGKVYKAIRKSDKTLVAIKKINCDNINNANQALVEFWPIRKISYPQLISIQDIYFSKPLDLNEYSSSLFTLCLVMEYMDCGDLEQFIIGHKQQGQSIQEAHLLSLMIQMAAGLNHLHLNGLLHRDIKGKNILLSAKFKECKIGDFGLIYNLRSLTSKNLNDTLASAGTSKYQSPECHIGVKDITELESSKQQQQPQASNKTTSPLLFMNYIYSSDVWSLGIVFLELVGCEMLSFSPYVMAMKDQQRFNEFIKQQCGNYHQEFANLITSMLSLEPKDRPDSEKIVRTLLNLKKELFGQQRTVKIHPVIEIHRQLLSVGKSVKGIFRGGKEEESNNGDLPASTAGGVEKSPSSRRTLSLHSVKNFFSGIHKVDDEEEEEDSPTAPPPEPRTSATSSAYFTNRDVFSFGMW